MEVYVDDLYDQLQALRQVADGMASVNEWSRFDQIISALDIDACTFIDPRVVSEKLRDAISYLSSEIDRLHLLHLFGLVPGSPSAYHLRNNAATKFLSDRGIASKSNVNDTRKKFIQKKNQMVLMKLARELAFSPHKLSERIESSLPGKDSSSNRFFVARPEVTSRIREWYMSSVPTLLLAGDSGNGKSLLAQNFADSLSGENQCQSITFDCSSKQSLLRSAREVLQDPGLTQDAIATRIAEFVGSNLFECLVIFDDCPNWSMVKDLLDATSRCIITSEYVIAPADRRTARVAYRRVEFIHVGPFSRAESISLVSHYRAEETEWADQFCELLGDKPRVMADCLGMYEEITLAEFIDVMKAERDRLLISAGNKASERAVHHMYELYLDRLEKTSPESEVLLSLLAWCGGPRVPRSVIEACLTRYYQHPQREKLHNVSVAITEGVNELQARFLVLKEDQNLVIHAITSRFFRHLTAGNVRAFEDVILEEADKCLSSLAKNAEIRAAKGIANPYGLTNEEIDWFWPVYHVAMRRPIGKVTPDDIDYWLGYLNNVSMQLGSFNEIQPLMKRFYEISIDKGIPFGMAYRFHQSGYLSNDAYAYMLTQLASENLKKAEPDDSAIGIEISAMTIYLTDPAEGRMECLRYLENFDVTRLPSISLCRALEWFGLEDEAVQVAEVAFHDSIDLTYRAMLLTAAISATVGINDYGRRSIWIDRLSEFVRPSPMKVSEAYLTEADSWVALARGDIREASIGFNMAAEIFESVGSIRNRSRVLAEAYCTSTFDLTRDPGSIPDFRLEDDAPLFHAYCSMYLQLRNLRSGVTGARNAFVKIDDIGYNIADISTPIRLIRQHSKVAILALQQLQGDGLEAIVDELYNSLGELYYGAAAKNLSGIESVKESLRKGLSTESHLWIC